MSPPQPHRRGPEQVSTGELHRIMLRLEYKLDHISADHETRLRRTERILLLLVGALGAGAGAGGITVATNLLTGGGLP